MHCVAFTHILLHYCTEEPCKGEFTRIGLQMLEESCSVRFVMTIGWQNVCVFIAAVRGMESLICCYARYESVETQRVSHPD